MTQHLRNEAIRPSGGAQPGVESCSETINGKCSRPGMGDFTCLIDLQPESLIFLIFLLFHGRALSSSPPSSGAFFRAAEGGRRFANETILFFAVDRIRSQDCSCVL